MVECHEFSWRVSDPHGNFNFVNQLCKQYNTSVDDIIITLGDNGLLYGGHDNPMSSKLREDLSTKPITFLVMRGNHDDRPSQYSLTPMYYSRFNATAYHDTKHANIYYAVDGEVYNLNNKKFLLIGGAYSVDKYYRLNAGYYWNPLEQLTDEEMGRISGSIIGQKFDFVLTHTCPYDWQPVEMFLDYPLNSIDSSMEFWLNRLNKQISYDRWIFGHYHHNKKDILQDGKVDLFGVNYYELVDGE